jgi:hypothetical protein
LTVAITEISGAQMTRSFHVIVLSISLVLTGACGDPLAPVEEPDVRAFVTGAASAALNERGHFKLRQSLPPTTFATIDQTRASELALAYLRTFAWPDVSIGSPLGHQLQKGHGAPIDLTQLKTTAVMLAQTPYEDAPDGSIAPVRNYLSPGFVIRLSASRTPVVNVWVSAYASDVVLRQDGRVELPKHSGGEFVAYANPKDSGYLHPIGPERAVVRAASATGALVAAVPELVLPGQFYSFPDSKWKIELDREVALQGLETPSTYHTRIVYVGTSWNNTGAKIRHDDLFVPLKNQPTASSGDDTRQRRPDRPVLFERVVPKS